MNTVTYTWRNTDNTTGQFYSYNCTEQEANLYLVSDLAYVQGYNVAAGDGWFTATNPDTGYSLTCTITN